MLEVAACNREPSALVDFTVTADARLAIGHWVGQRRSNLQIACAQVLHLEFGRHVLPLTTDLQVDQSLVDHLDLLWHSKYQLYMTLTSITDHSRQLIRHLLQLSIRLAQYLLTIEATLLVHLSSGPVSYIGQHSEISHRLSVLLLSAVLQKVVMVMGDRPRQGRRESIRTSQSRPLILPSRRVRTTLREVTGR